MGSDANKMNSFHLSEPSLCANGCGFFGSAATMNLCSKCFNNQRLKAEHTASAKATMDKLVNKVVSFAPHEPVLSPSSSSPVCAPKVSNRCLSCNKKVGVMGFTCKCGETFCGSHRYAEEHGCVFDFKRTGRDAIKKANPVVKADKVNRI